MNHPHGFSRTLKWPVPVIVFCGAACLALGLMVLAGWHTGNAAFVRIRPNLVAMQYITALCLVCGGAGLSAAGLRLPRPVTAVCGGLAGAAGLLLCLEHFFGWSLGFALLLPHLPEVPGVVPGRPAAPTCAALALCGLNLLLLGLPLSRPVRRVATWILSSSALALSLVVLSADILGFSTTFVKGAAIGMSPHTIAGLLFLSLGLLATQFRDPGRLLDDRWLPLPLAVGTMAGAVMLWQALTVDRTRAIQRQAEIMAQNLAADYLSRLRFSLRALELMKLRWEHRGGTPYSEWQADAKASLQDEPIFEAIGRTDATWRVERVEPPWDESTPFDLDPHEERRWDAARALAEAQATGKMVVSPSMDLSADHRGFIAYFPLSTTGGFDGFLFGVFRLKQLVHSSLQEPALAHCRVSIFEGPDLILEQPALKAGEGGITAESKADFYGHHWRFVVEPKKKETVGGALPRIVLWLGLLLGLAKAAAVLAFQQFRGRNHNIQAAYLQLQEEIAGRAQVELELRETLRAKNAAQTLLETAGRIARMGHWELKLDGGNPRWSVVMYEIHELPPDTPVTLAMALDFFHPADRPAIQAKVGKSLQTGEVYEFEARLITARGRQIWVQLRGEPLRGEDGRINALHGILQDIDDRHQAGELLQQRNRELETATTRAEAHARAKTEFLANMSHEIRTPLNAVIGMSELLMDGQLDDREREFVETIHSSGDVLLSLINDILDFSKIESGQLDLERIPVSLRDCVESVLDLLAAQAARKQLDLMYWIDPEVPPAVQSDPTRLRQVLVNLAGNAIKFTARGEVFVKLSVRKEEKDGDGRSWLHVEVRDTGIGISPDGMERLFGVFSQVDASTTRRFGGTGLGLAISQRIIQHMGGRIWVDSEEGQGSTFQFEIPLLPAEAPETGELSSGTEKTEGTDSLAGMKILIVDDNGTNRGILRRQTESWGMLPVVAGSAREALDRIAGGETFHLALIDGLMPEMDGYELAAAIRLTHTAQELPILILTSMGDLSRDWKSLGISGVLTKPVRNAPLFSAVRGILSRRPVTARRPRPAQPPAAETSAPVPPPPPPLRILVAEDNAVNQRVVALHLQRMGYPQPRIAANGLEVLAALEASRFDVILLDVQMPVMDGLTAAREICRLYPPGRRPWMIALTANAQGSDRDECLEAGMNDYLSKPVRGENLRMALQTAFEHKIPD